jgi:hypothetical protein
VFSALSVPRLYNASPLAAERVSEFRVSRVIEKEMARRLYSDLERFCVEIILSTETFAESLLT